jgi:hypothetical protein
MKTYGEADEYTHIFLTSVLVEVSGQLHVLAALHPGKELPFPFDSSAKLTTHLHLVLSLRMMELYFHYPIRLNGVMLN